MTAGVFITGTDTGVGKTWVGAALAQLLTQGGRRVRARKPVESGCVPGPDGLHPQDAAALREAAGAVEPLDRMCPYRLEAPFSPERAAALAGIALDLQRLVQACGAGVEDGDFLLVEGAGGFCSPLTADHLNADLAVALQLPVLLVTADRLGAIHQVLVTAEAIERRGLRLAGVVLNRVVPGSDPDMDNAAALARRLGREVVTVPHGHLLGIAQQDGTASALTGLADRLAAGIDDRPWA